MNNTHFNCLRLNLCQESQKPRILSRDFSQPDQSGSDTDRQTNRQTNRRSTYRRSKTRRGVDLEKIQLKIGKLYIASSTSFMLLQNLGNVQFERFTQDLKDCLHRNKCTEVIKIIQSLGHLQSIFKDM